ncbi:DNA-binding transcriptional regulator, AcrR family [Nonomuraea solani]|uniref:DNA-binding transcriptional regulator, AcrR family n=1 Tax=Nonomuraea solani TaxID=1144553 RepID=A0A1H6EIR3_9ACTN|nr:TetR/AcrR family transcriptional regulator [Nonomuraea solani]SEG97780.1 DNA-binding transcriptional regulator, AcrR family [Nonomuraea solani]
MKDSAAARSTRKDSLRNRELLITAARQVFAERGFSATLDDIARHAGLGTGTAYRNFPNKQALAAEVLSEATERILADARAALEVEDPWAGLVVFFERAAARQAADRGLYESLSGRGDHEEQARIWPEIVAAVTELYERAHRAGVIRADAAAQDIAAIFALLGPAFEMSRATSPELWRRYLALILDGFRATERPALPVPPPPADALNAILRAGKRTS